MAGVFIRNLTRSRYAGSHLLFSSIIKEVLPDWEISLVFVGSAKARALNKKLRNKNYVPEVLSYILGEKSGEVIICPSAAAKQAHLHFMEPRARFAGTSARRAYCLYLFIHGVLHISGQVHSGTMRECERKLLARFALNGKRSFASSDRRNTGLTERSARNYHNGFSKNSNRH